MITFESPRKRANRFLVMLGLFGLLTIASIILTLSEISLLEQNQAGEEVTYSDIVAPLDNLWIISSVRLLIAYLVCVVLFLMWKHRASKKSRSFRGIQSTILPAVGSSVLLHPNIKLVPSLSSDEGNLSP